MNRALIFAGGRGVRMKMNGDIPKQFLEINGKSIIAYTLEKFQRNEFIDDIVVVCIESWIDVLEEQVKKYSLTKISKILPGGETGFDSRMIGLQHMYDTRETDEDIILIHDGVRPFITEDLISENIDTAKKFGNAITIAKATETIMYRTNGTRDQILDRSQCLFARAPQTFKISRVYELYEKALADGKTEIIDSASMAYYYGDDLYYVEGPQENIKVTTPIDYFSASGILNSDIKELDKYK